MWSQFPRIFVISVASMVLAACGGDGGGGHKPAASATITSGPVTRMVAAGTSVHAAVTLTLNFAPAGALSVRVQPSPATPFEPTVPVVSGSGGEFTLDVVTSSTAAAGHYSGSATLKLCADAACTQSQPASSVSLPYTIDVLDSGVGWPGDHLTTLSAWAGVPDWSTFQGNSAHTGFVPVDLDADNFTTRWRIAGTGQLSSWTNTPQTVATSGGLLFLSDGSGNLGAGATTLSARRESDASVVWQYDFSELQFPSANPPAVSGGTVYVAAGQQSSTFLYAFDAAGGSLIFKAPMSSQWEHYLAPAVGAAGVYTNAGSYGGLFAFAPTGAPLYFAPLEQTSMWSPAVDTNGVYVYTGALRVFDPVTGALRTSISDPTFSNYVYEIGGAPVLGDSGMVFAANYANSVLNGGTLGNTLSAFDINGGVVAWHVAGNYPSTPSYHAGHLYVANENPLRLEVRTAATGVIEWTWVPPAAADTAFVSEVLVTNNLLFVSTDYAVYVIDLTSHQVVWSYPDAGRLALSNNGVLYLQKADLITAFNLK